jgi:hypothetical protein
MVKERQLHMEHTDRPERKGCKNCGGETCCTRVAPPALVAAQHDHQGRQGHCCNSHHMLHKPAALRQRSWPASVCRRAALKSPRAWSLERQTHFCQQKAAGALCISCGDACCCNSFLSFQLLQLLVPHGRSLLHAAACGMHRIR